MQVIYVTHLLVFVTNNGLLRNTTLLSTLTVCCLTPQATVTKKHTSPHTADTG